MILPRKLSSITEEEAEKASFVLIYQKSDGGIDALAQSAGRWYTLNIERLYSSFEEVRKAWFDGDDYFVLDIVWNNDIEEFRKQVP